MIPRTLRLEPADASASGTTAAPPAVAWCLPGAAAEQWIDEITRWQLRDEGALRLFVLPASIRSRQPAGLFAIPGPGDAPRVRPAGLAFTRLGRGLYLPVDAVLLPALTPAEADAVNTCSGAFVLHPGIGPVGFDHGDEVTFGDLLIPPPERIEEWTAPLPGTAPLPRLQSVLVKPPTLEDLFGEDSREIGSDPAQEFLEPPPEGAAPQGPPPRRPGGMARFFLGLTRKFVEKLPRTEGGRTVWNRLEDWVNQRLHTPHENLQDDRHQALERLLEQLRNNPDEGLKHALPLAGSSLHRGTAPPSSKLGTRSPSFDLGRLGGGRAVDAWDVSQEQQQELRRQYMELANREVQLGRHRRAAYIYAELLGDLSTAAIVLKNGGHYSEAALIYLDHLYRPLEAAECFALAGQVAEAVKLYEEGRRWDKLAALYRDLQQHEKMRSAFQSWIAELVQNDDLMQAASLTLNDLEDREAALHLLEGAWPASRQAVNCIERALELRGTAGEHREATRLLESLAQPAASARVHQMLGIFGNLQRTYPDRLVKARAEDLGRREIARLLPTVPDGQRGSLMRLLQCLSPSDTLLARDGRRHVEEHQHQVKQAPARAPRPHQPPSAGKVTLSALFSASLPWPTPKTTVLQAAAVHDCFCLLAYDATSPRLLALHAGFREAATARLLEWYLPVGTWNDRATPLLVAARNERRFFAHLPHDPGALHQHSLPPQHNIESRVEIGTPNWFADPVWAATYDAHGYLWVLRLTRIGWRLSQFSPPGQMVRDLLVEGLDDLSQPPGPLPMVATSTHVVLGIGPRVLLIPGPSTYPERHFEEITFDTPVRALVSAPAWSSPRVAVVTEGEAHVLWLGGKQPHAMLVASDLDPAGASATFTNDGALHLLNGDRGTIILANHTGTIQRWHFDLPRKATAILPCADLWTFATLDETSTLSLWRYDGRNLQVKAV